MSKTEYPAGFLTPYHTKKPICGVLALALAANVSFDVAQAACRNSMLALGLGKRFGGRTYASQIEHALKGFGVSFDRVDVEDHMSLQTAVSEGFLDMKSHYIVNKVGHFFTLKNGYVIDQSRNMLYHECDFKRKKVKSWLKINGKVWA